MSLRFSTRFFKIAGLVLLVGLGAWMRWTAVVDTEVEKPVRGDAEEYMAAARNLVKYGVYSEHAPPEDDGEEPAPSAKRSPGFPLWAALFMDPDDMEKSMDRILLGNWALSIISLVLLAFLFYRVLPYWACCAVLFLVAISPHLININVYLLTEPLFTLGVSAIFAVYWLVVTRPGVASALGLGAMLGLTNLVRPSLLLLALPLVVFMAFKLPSHVRWKSCAAMLAVSVVISLSWNVRNLVSIDSFSDPQLSANFLHHGMYPGFEYKDRDFTFGYPYRFDPKSEVLSGNVPRILDEIGNRFQQQPGKHLHWYFLGKPAFLYSWDIVAGFADIFVYKVKKTPYSENKLFDSTNLISYYVHGPMVALAFLGVFFVWLPSFWPSMSSPQRHLFQFSSLFIIYFTGFHVIGAPFPRYGIPVRPFVYMQAFFVLGGIYEHVRETIKNARSGRNYTLSE